jgi:hypothetical protein
MISSPAALASALLLETIAVRANVPCSPALNRHDVGNVTDCAGWVAATSVEVPDDWQLTAALRTTSGSAPARTNADLRVNDIGLSIGSDRRTLAAVCACPVT